MTGQQARHYPLTEVFEVDMVNTLNIAQDGAIIETQANRGISNSDASEIQLLGDVTVRQKNPNSAAEDILVTGDFIQAWPLEDRVQSPRPAVVTSGPNRFKGDHLAYDNLSQIIELKGRVQGTIFPPATQRK